MSIDRHSDAPSLICADLTGCESLRERTPAELMTIFADTLRTAGATVVNSVAHVFPGEAVTCVLVLAESHATLHTWPETGTINIDIFCCSQRLNARAAIEALARAVEAAEVAVQECVRADGRRPALTPR